jgi:hypothetical protein
MLMINVLDIVLGLGGDALYVGRRAGGTSLRGLHLGKWKLHQGCIIPVTVPDISLETLPRINPDTPDFLTHS